MNSDRRIIEAAIGVSICVLVLLMVFGYTRQKDLDKKKECAQSVCPPPMKPLMAYRQGCVCVTLPVIPNQGDQP